MRLTRAAVLLGIVAVAAASIWLTGSATPADDPAQQAIKQFQGSWHAIAVQHADGSPAPTEEVLATRLVVDGNKFTLINKQMNVSGTFTVNPSKTPRTIDVTLKTADGPDVTLLGIYAIKSDLRKSCFALPGKERPARFMTGESGYVGFTWARN
jgi:uncharacterized protein (TIGR03067 family)